jgi:predicted  nucleic acid-binding Zn-ribbon protein
MFDDPIVEDTRSARAEIVSECNEDVHTFFEYIRSRERNNPEGVVTLEPNAPDSIMQGSTAR